MINRSNFEIKTININNIYGHTLASIVKIDRCQPQPSSNEIPYWELWKNEWKDMNFDELKNEWYR